MAIMSTGAAMRLEGADVGDLATLGNVPLFRDLAPELLALVAAEATRRDAPAGTVVFEMGADGEELFVVTRGLVQIVLPGMGGGDDVVAELGDGRWFGEMAIITGEPRWATARAAVDTELLVLTRASFHVLLARMPVLGVRLSEELSRRLRARLVASSRDDSHRVIVLEDTVGSTESGAAASEIAAAIADELDGTIAYVDLGAGGPHRARRGVQGHRCATIEDVERLRRSHGVVVLRVPTGHPLSAPVRALPGATVDATALGAGPAHRSRAQIGVPVQPVAAAGAPATRAPRRSGAWSGRSEGARARRRPAQLRARRAPGRHARRHQHGGHRRHAGRTGVE